jgi:hypothetical protein
MPKFRHKVTVISGDCSMPGLGLKPSDRNLLTEDVNLVFHGAATVRFDEKLRLAVGINVAGTRSVIELAQEMKKLKVRGCVLPPLKLLRRVQSVTFKTHSNNQKWATQCNKPLPVSFAILASRPT